MERQTWNPLQRAMSRSQITAAGWCARTSWMPSSPSPASSTFQPATVSHLPISLRKLASSSINTTVFIRRPGGRVSFSTDKNKHLTGQIKVEFAPADRYPGPVSRLKTLLLLILTAGSAFNAEAATPRIIKALPHLLDTEGRHTLSPSLYQRRAYHGFLRKKPGKSSWVRLY